MTAAGPAVLPLLEDGSLRLEADSALAPLLRRWLPLLPYPESAAADPSSARIRVLGDESALPHSRTLALSRSPSLRLGTADVWVDGDSVSLRGGAGCAGKGDLGTRSIDLAAPAEAGDAEAVAWDLYSMCTLSSALLLGRMRRALTHAAAVVAPDGGCWLLVGDTHAGKSTTCANLLGAGWGFVTDDHGVLFRDAAGRLTVEGWPRPFHLDEGWESGAPVHRRGEVDPHARWPGQWRRTAPLAGLLFPRVRAQRPTELAPLAPSAALSGLLRQSPWLLADRAAAPAVLELLRAACELPVHSLRLGLDTYRDVDRLRAVLAPLAS